jgi:hypothetical protein
MRSVRGRPPTTLTSLVRGIACSAVENSSAMRRSSKSL